MVKFIIPEDKGYLIVVIHQDNSMLLPKTLQGLKDCIFSNISLNFLSSYFFVAIVRDSRSTPPVGQKEELMEAKVTKLLIKTIREKLS